MLESTEVEAASTKPSGTAGRSGVRRSLRPVGSGVRGRSASPGPADPATVFHNDDEGLCFSISHQIVQDQVGTALVSPAGFIFARAMLEIKHRVSFGRILVIVRRSVDIAMAG